MLYFLKAYLESGKFKIQMIGAILTFKIEQDVEEEYFDYRGGRFYWESFG